MSAEIVVRTAIDADVADIARLHVETWRETYRGLMADEILDDPDFVGRRELFWRAALTDPRFPTNRVAVAHRDDSLVGIAIAGPATEAGTDCGWQLYVLYTSASIHGLGAGGALLDLVLEPRRATVLWVADPNPRAQAFYRKSGFVWDGTVKLEDGVRELRMVRSPSLSAGS